MEKITRQMMAMLTVVLFLGSVSIGHETEIKDPPSAKESAEQANSSSTQIVVVTSSADDVVIDGLLKIVKDRSDDLCIRDQALKLLSKIELTVDSRDKVLISLMGVLDDKYTSLFAADSVKMRGEVMKVIAALKAVKIEMDVANPIDSKPEDSLEVIAPNSILDQDVEMNSPANPFDVEGPKRDRLPGPGTKNSDSSEDDADKSGASDAASEEKTPEEVAPDEDAAEEETSDEDAADDTPGDDGS